MITLARADSKYIKNINRSNIIEQIINNKKISRADISKNIGLNKVTVSSQVYDLLDENLIIEEKTETANVGRNPILLLINKEAAYSIGVEIDFNKLVFVITNLVGEVISKSLIKIDNISLESIVDKLFKEIDIIINNLSTITCKIIGISIGIHGIVNNEGIIVFSPSLKWRNINLKKIIQERYNFNVYIQNNNQFSILAEKTFNFHDCNNILYLNISSGIGLGILINNEIYKGINGFAGEVGHMIVEMNGKECSCGNKGCLEMYCSERVIFKELNKVYKDKSDNNILNNINNPNDILILKDFINYLSLGLNNIINSFNSGTIIINSRIIKKYTILLDEIIHNLSSDMNDYNRIVLSGFDEISCALGACLYNIKGFLNIKNMYL